MATGNLYIMLQKYAVLIQQSSFKGHLKGPVNNLFM